MPRTHRATGTRTYRIWTNMNQRCFDKNHHKYPLYGGRGITVCARWHGVGGFEKFLAEMGECPTGLTIDRHPNNNGNYEKSNCRWATMKLQNRNRRDNISIVVFGKLMLFAEACDLYDVGYQRAYKRMKRGWSPEETFTGG